MKYCVIKNKADNLIRMSQKNIDNIEIMKQNAINAGLSESDVDIIILNQDEYSALLELQPMKTKLITEEEQQLLDLELAMAQILGGGI